MLSLIDSEERHVQLLTEICDHMSDRRAIPKRFGFTVSKNGKNNPKNITVGRKLQVEWKYVLVE